MNQPTKMVIWIFMICLSFFSPLGVATAGADKFTAVGAGNAHSCAITSGQVWCWGSGWSGQKGNPADIFSSKELQVLKQDSKPLTGVSSISMGGNTSCAVAGGAAWCWGGNSSGQVGNNTTRDSDYAVQVKKTSGAVLTGVVQISVGDYHTCARTNVNQAWCWGNNSFGEVGDGSETDRLGAVQVRASGGTPLGGVWAISAGDNHTCANVRGKAMCWGDNYDGQLGSNPIDWSAPDYYSSVSPVTVIRADTDAPLSNITGINAGGNHTCASTTTDVWCWGLNTNGQLGNRTTVTAKGAVRAKKLAPNVAIAGVTKLAAGSNFTCAMARDGVWCWGANDSGQLGDNTTSQRLAAVIVKSATTTPSFSVGTTIEAGDKHTCATAASGVWCWGYNSSGQLDGKTQVERHAPFRVYW